MELELEEEVEGLRVRLVQDDAIWAAGRGKVYRTFSGRDWEEVADPVENALERFFGRSGLYSRLLRRGVHDVFRLDSGDVLVIANGKFFKLTQKDSLQKVHELRRGKRPLRQGITSDETGVYYGEYWTNPDRDEVRVYAGSKEGNGWEPVHVFSEGSIRHIHSLRYDPFEDLIWVTTGDRNEECQVAFSSDHCKSFHSIGDGSQTWRTAGPVFTEDYVFWGTDNPKGENYIIRWDRDAGEIERIASVVGPIYYGKRVDGYIVFSSAVERGEADQDGYARIYGLRPGEEVEELYRLKKDFYHPILFGYGWFEFPHGQVDGSRFWAATKGLEGGRRSFLFKIKG